MATIMIAWNVLSGKLMSRKSVLGQIFGDIELNGRLVEQRCIQHQSELFQFLNEFCIWFSSKFSLVIWSLDPRISLSSLMNALSSFTFSSLFEKLFPFNFCIFESTGSMFNAYNRLVVRDLFSSDRSVMINRSSAYINTPVFIPSISDIKFVFIISSISSST
ncbi:hypothetical protein BpHYR1_027147 [Brachionus plicatilis]|uniref:Uncharacterized protein n=1 Tax=Brachionus plicatilis TaxID=10195 RepID=A0A3M7QF46_BRAPC|nr:hypothetical protein BpHYR1_027147 [Brachionus plicatilis]